MYTLEDLRKIYDYMSTQQNDDMSFPDDWEIHIPWRKNIFEMLEGILEDGESELDQIRDEMREKGLW